jgi:hypothetical protein
VGEAHGLEPEIEPPPERAAGAAEWAHSALTAVMMSMREALRAG